MNEMSETDEHVGEFLSGLVDNELTQQDSQRVQLHVDRCAACRAELQSIREFRDAMGNARLGPQNERKWRETMDDATVKTSRGIGWLMVIGGVLVAAGFAAIELVRSFPSWGLLEKLIIGGIYGGMLLLFLSVLRQRLIERKKDRYKDVEI